MRNLGASVVVIACTFVLLLFDAIALTLVVGFAMTAALPPTGPETLSKLNPLHTTCAPTPVGESAAADSAFSVTRLR